MKPSPSLSPRIDRKWALAALPLALAVVLSARPAAAQSTTPATNVTASATVVTPLTISSASALNFGTFAAGGTTGTVTISPSGSPRASSGGVTLVATSAGTASSVVLAGTPSTAFTLNLPGSTVSLTGPGSAMTLSNFTTNLSGTGLGGTGVGGAIGSSGSLTFAIGATLNVGANQAAGSYSATFPITVTYQ